MNLYAYVGNDPLKATDPSGKVQRPEAWDPDSAAFEREQQFFEAARQTAQGLAEVVSQLPSAADAALGDGVIYVGAEGTATLGWAGLRAEPKTARMARKENTDGLSTEPRMNSWSLLVVRIRPITLRTLSVPMLVETSTSVGRERHRC